MNKIKKLVEKTGKSYKQFGSLFPVSKQTIWRWCTDCNSVDYKKPNTTNAKIILSIAKHYKFDLTLNEIL